jgi:dUTP pyrophosphatase
MSILYLCTNADTNSFYLNLQASPQNAGIDLYVPKDVVFAPGERKMVSMGVSAVITDLPSGEDSRKSASSGFKDVATNSPQNYWMLPRSSISKTGLMMMNSVGVIDKSYRGELIAALWNTTGSEVTVSKGQRLVQLVTRDMRDIVQVSCVSSLDSFSSDRGSGGFGSTGI